MSYEKIPEISTTYNGLKSQPDVNSKRFCIDFDDVLEAGRRIGPFIVQTPMVQCSTLNRRSGFTVHLKAENLQTTGSFKYRGNTNAVELLMEKEVDLKCTVTYSCGNHGQALAKACQVRGVKSVIVVPPSAGRCKRKAIRSYGGEVLQGGDTEQDLVDLVEAVCKERGAVFMTPARHPAYLSGYGTIAVEMIREHPELEALVIPVGEGAFMGGVAIAAKSLNPSIRIFAAEPANACGFHISMKEGKRTDVKRNFDTIADGVECDIAENAWDIMEELVEASFVVGEEEIIEATKMIWKRAKLVIEPTSGVAVAVVMSEAFAQVAKGKLRHVGLVMCGGNVDMDSFCKFFS